MDKRAKNYVTEDLYSREILDFTYLNRSCLKRDLHKIFGRSRDFTEIPKDFNRKRLHIITKIEYYY